MNDYGERLRNVCMSLAEVADYVEELEDDLHTARRVGKDWFEAQKEARNDALRAEAQVKELRTKLEDDKEEARLYWYNQGKFDAIMEMNEDKRNE